jgi:hypothetical protein
MAQVLTEGTNLNVAVETTLGTLPTTGWLNVQPNSLGDIGPSIGKIARTPISKNRQLQQPIVTDLDSAAPWQSDVTKDLIDAFLGGIFMSAVKHNGGTGTAYFRPTAVTATDYTVASGGALAANILVYARGFSIAGNNGLKVLSAASTGTAIKTAGLTAEAAPPANVTLEVAGVQGAAGDIGIDASGNLTSTANIFTTLGLQVGQWIRLGDLPSGAAFAFANTAYVGFAKIKAIAAGLLTLERRSWTVGSADTGTGKTIRIFFGRWARNVAYDHADFLKTSYSFEVTYPQLGAGPADEYEYVRGNMVDSWTWNIPLTSKATAELGFIGTTSNDPTTVRQAGASTAIAPVTQVALSSSTDLQRLRISNIDETGITTDFKDVKITIKNNVSPEKTLGNLGATYMNVGRFEVTVDTSLVLTSDDVIKAVRDNRRVMMDFVMRNGDFGALIDVMSASLMGVDRNFPTNSSVLLSVQATGFQDPTYSATCGMTVFPYLPAS